MAKIKFGATVVGARGTLGGITFSANKSGPYIKQWARSSTPRTTLQQVQRSTWSQAALSWQALSAANRTSWDTFALTTAPPEVDAFGDDYRISGFAWFTRSSSFRDQGGFVPLTAAPGVYNVNVPAVTVFRFFTTAGGDTSRIQYLAGTFTTQKWLYCEGAVLNNQGATSPNIKMKRILNDSTPAGTAQGIQVELETLFGDIVLGQRLIWRVYVCDDEGYLSVPVSGFSNAAT